MTRTMALWALVIGTIGLGIADASPARADDASGAAIAADRAWGLSGTWAQDCRGTPSPGNIKMSFTIERGSMFVGYDGGKSYLRRWPIRAIEHAAGGRLAVTSLEAQDVAVLTTYERHPDGRLRPFESFRIDTGAYTIQNATYKGQKASYPWLMRCDQQTS